MPRTTSSRRSGIAVHLHARYGRKHFGIGGVVGLVVVIALAAVRGVNATPSWHTVDQDTIDIPPDQSFALEYNAPEQIRFRISAEEVSGKPLQVYWLDQKDYNSIQSADIEMDVVQRMMTQSIGSGSTIKTEEVSLGPGTVNICFEAAEEVETKVKYTIEAYQ